MSKLPEPIVILNALGHLSKKKKQSKVVALLEASTPSYDFYNSDWGIDFYMLELSIPFDIFADGGEVLSSTAESLGEAAKEITSQYSEERVTDVRFIPNLDSIPDWRTGEKPISAKTDDVDRIWKPGHFRLFISHSSHDKVFAAELKESLGHVRIAGFVAHDAIEPSRHWQSEIEIALATCHAMVFLASSEANTSPWSHQEIGWGLGRGILVQPVKLTEDPKALLGSVQAQRVRAEKTCIHLRQSLMEIFLKSDKAERYMHDPLAVSLQSVKKVEGATSLIKLLDMTTTLAPEMLEKIDLAKKQNPIISGNSELVKSIDALLKKHGHILPKSKAATAPSEDEYDPFADE